ncbi:MAG: hypothetical protein AAFP76_06400 [Bacteroidota bacterium]
MKHLVYILLLFPALAFGQRDFETRYFTIDAESLPDTQELSSFDIDFGETRSFEKKHITDFNKVTVKNYWQPVDMTTAMENEAASFSGPTIDLPKLKQKQFGFSVTMLDRNSFDGTQPSRYGVRNTVYKEQRGYYFCGIGPGYLLGRN